ncbi:MAG: endonuclease domain-containing protein [Cyclobacteriaceae bacterium]|nr:endonuclease domain-containing protein [Cyclobacteriaceae bacterium]
MPLNHSIVKICRELRRNQTPEEELVWQHLRNRQLGGFKFLRQHPFVFGGTPYRPEFYVADFYCAEKKLVVELDGRIHDSQLGYDRDRDEVMTELGLHVLRIRNEELNNLDVVLNKIRAACSNSPPFPLSTL